MVSWTAFGQVFEPLVLPLESDEMGDFTEISDENLVLHDQLNDLDLNIVTLRQMGQENAASIMQFSNSKAPSLIVVSQVGDHNSSILFQAGKNNAAQVAQEGDMNSYFGVHVGDGLVNSVLQEGNENVVRQFLYGNDMDFHIIQDGNSNVINQIQNGSGIGYSVKQVGDDMKVTVIQDHVMRW
jgi:minor curlin subunit